MATDHWLPVWLASSMPPGTSFLCQTAPKCGDQHCEEGPGLERPPSRSEGDQEGRAVPQSTLPQALLLVHHGKALPQGLLHGKQRLIFSHLLLWG